MATIPTGRPRIQGNIVPRAPLLGRASVRFPARVIASDGLGLNIANGVYTFSLAPEELAALASLPAGDLDNLFVITYNSTGSPTLARLSLELISDAILDGLVAPEVRTKITGDVTYYVRADGSDLFNTGLADTAGGAFRTLQKAINVLLTLDGGGFIGTIRIGGTGVRTFTGGISLTTPFVGFASVTVIGDVTTHSNCVISTTSADCARVSNYATLNIQGFTFVSAISGYALNATVGGIINFNRCTFGACASGHMQTLTGGKIVGATSYSVTGQGFFHWVAQGAGSNINMVGVTITVSAGLTFSAWASSSRAALIESQGNTFAGAGAGTGTAGAKFAVFINGTIFVNGAGVEHLPGTAGSGSSSSDGVYA